MPLSETTSSPAVSVTLSQPPCSKLARERQAFHQLLPQLLSTHRGQYVAIHDGQVAESGSKRLEVAMRLWQRIGRTDIYVGLVSDQPAPVVRSGVRRDMGQPEDVR